MRKIAVKQFKRGSHGGWIEDGENIGLFHGWGTYSDSNGPDAVAVTGAIVEGQDGTVTIFPVEHVRFCEPPPKDTPHD